MSDFKISVYEKNDGTFQVSFINPLDLKRKRRTFKSKKEALAYQDELKSQYLKGGVIPSDKMYVGNLVTIFATKYSRSTMFYTRWVFIDFCEHFNHFPISKLTKEPLENWFDQLREKKDYAEKTLAKIKCHFNHFFKWLVDEEIIQVNPLEKLRFKQTLPPKRARVILSGEEIATLAKELQEFGVDYLHTMIYTIIHTGCRRSEALNLKWEDVDFSNGTIVFRKTKNGTDRQIRMSQQLHNHLIVQPRQSPYVLSDEAGNRPAKNRLIEEMKQFKLGSSLRKDWKPHDLRHTFAFHFLRSGREMYQLKAILGHKTIGMTVDLYGNLKAGDVDHPSPFNC